MSDQTAEANTSITGSIERLHIGDNIYYSPPHGSITSSQDETAQQESEWQKATDCITQSQTENLDLIVQLHGFETSPNHIPEVHPQLVLCDIYKGNDTGLASSSESRQNTANTDQAQIISFDKLLTIIVENRFTTLVGVPGCGKSTLSKRIAKFLIAKEYFVVHLKFMDLNYDSETKLTLQQFLIDYQFNDVEEVVHKNAFKWMVKNQSKTIVVLDGFDQATWSLKDVKPLKTSYETPLPVQQIFANLCSKRFLGKAHLVVTSRSSPILSLCSEMRPNVTVSVADLTTESMMALFNAFAGPCADNLWELLTSSLPLLIDLCKNPLLLQFIVYACLHCNVDQINTVTKVLLIVLRQLKYSDLSKSQEFHDLIEPLGRMAYNGMVEKRVTFTAADLAREGLIDVSVQDFVIKVPRKQSCLTNRRLFEGNMLLYFMHEMLQEIFAACYVAKFMPTEEFDQIVLDIVSEGHWSMVRRFLCGILFGDALKIDTSKDEKTEAFFNAMVQLMNASNTMGGNELLDLLEDLQECSEDSKETLANFLAEHFVLNLTPIASNQAHAIEIILPRCTETEYLHLSGCDLSLNSLQRICVGISGITTRKLKFVDLSLNQVGDEGARIICKCVQSVHWLCIKGCGISARGAEILSAELRKPETSLVVLDMSDNPIGDDGLQIMSECLEGINTISLEGCGASPVAIVQFCEKLDELGILRKKVKGLWEPCENLASDDSSSSSPTESSWSTDDLLYLFESTDSDSSSSVSSKEYPTSKEEWSEESCLSLQECETVTKL